MRSITAIARTNARVSQSRRIKADAARLALVALCIMVAFDFRPATAQSPQARTPLELRVGDACTMRPDSRQGVIKVDACGRLYCGREDVKNIIEVRPNIAAQLGCEWQLVNQRCRCVRNPAPTQGTAPR